MNSCERFLSRITNDFLTANRISSDENELSELSNEKTSFA